ncbi:unnamed protein product [Acanthoscelides obtectus]|uniref:F-box domain-containing protein n=1 Tax=Acanthoscelides obtectus TaxID=200917 RepID=A0A9P0PAD0_ACAOB|nr:unnamed protein product [Acanthoscelides obtectus]CAK1665173.1 hypothetical protein AOBTE_LOCUS24694 [Acanthoscelides obtectus]
MSASSSRKRHSIADRSGSNEEKEDTVPRKRCRQPSSDPFSTLPNEVMIKIFSYLTHEELYKTARCVCTRWYVLASAPVLWKTITAQQNVPSNVLLKWLEHSPLLQELNLTGRDDVDVVTGKVSRHCRKLESLKIENTGPCKLLRSSNLCRLLTKCKQLNNLHFSGVKILSCKFFKLFSRRKHSGMKRCSYHGPVSQKQMKALIESIINSDNFEAATLVTADNRKIPIKTQSNREFVNVPVTVENIWQDVTSNSVNDFTDVDDADYEADLDE